MIFSFIIIAIVGVVAFFHYVQGFFSATISAIITIIAAVLAVSFHEPVVEAMLGGKAANVAHGMVLAGLFAVIYFVLRLLFDKMVPGNVRVPAILDKVGGGAMGVIAGVFGAGVVALIAQYMPFMPAIAGYARFTVDSREVTVPAMQGGRMITSEVWHELKSNRPGQFDTVDKSGMIIPADDIVVNTVAHLSDGGSLSGKQRLTDVHPDLLTGLFAQRLGVQTGAGRVVTRTALESVELFQAPSLKFRDHDFTAIRKLELKGFPATADEVKPTPKQILLIVRVTFTKYAGDSDHFVRFSPGSARLVTNGSGGERVDYYPIGTVDSAQTLYLSKPDDFLVAKDDKGADLAYLVDRSGFVAGGGQGPTLKVSEGTFFEFKRLAREDFTGKSISSAYKASEAVKVERKTVPEDPNAPEPATPPAPTAGNLDTLKERLVGNWMGSSDAGQLVIEFNADGTLKINNTPRSGLPLISDGSWEALRAEGDNKLVIKRTIKADAVEATISFSGNDDCTLTSANTAQPIPLKRRS